MTHPREPNDLDAPDLLGQVELQIIDAAAHARTLYGDKADYVVGRTLPKHDYRFHANLPSGGCITFHTGATAEHIMSHLAEETTT